MGRWIDLNGLSAGVLCLFSKSISLRVSIPRNNKYTITGDGGSVVVYGDRYTIEALKLPGGQCPYQEYRIKGSATRNVTTFDDKKCGVLFSVINANGIFIGPILDFREYTVTLINPDGSIQSQDYWIEVVHDNGNAVYNERSQWQFDFANIDPDCYSTFNIDPELVEQGATYSFSVSISANVGDTVNYFGWERVDGATREQDEACASSSSEFRIQVLDCNDEVVYNGVYKERPKVLVEFNTYDDPIELRYDLYRVQGINAIFGEVETSEGTVKAVQLELTAPLVTIHLDDDNPLLDEPSQIIEIGTYQSPVCESRPPRVEYFCDCNEFCPPGTTCKVQKGSSICCYASDGTVLKVISTGCEIPDVVC